MKKELNLVKILKRMPVGTKLYSIMHGEVECRRIREQGEYNIVVSDRYGCFHSYTKEGRFKIGDLGECLLYPSKECRDWSNFKVDLPEDTPVMVSSDKIDWSLRFYHKDTYAYNLGRRCGSLTSWQYIVPVDKFDFKDLTFNTEDNYGTANY